MPSRTKGHERPVLKEVLTVRVAFADTDAMGVAWHGNYLRWFEMARTELLRLADFPYRGLVDRDIHLPVIEACCRYLRPARYDDVLVIFCSLEELKGARVRLEYRIDIEGKPIAGGHTAHAFTDAGGRVIRPPKDVVEALLRTRDL